MSPYDVPDTLSQIPEMEGLDPAMMDPGMMPEQEPPAPDEEEIKKAFSAFLIDAREDDRYVREMHVRLWRRLEYYWNNILDIFMDPVARDWRVPDWEELAASGEVPPRLINIYRPHGEAVVAALSVAIPSVIFHPDDADNPDDIEASKAYAAIVELLATHNEAPMLFIRALVIIMNQGTVFGYNYYTQDPKYGTLNKPRVEFKDVDLFTAYCPQCGEPLDGGIMPQMAPGMENQGGPPSLPNPESQSFQQNPESIPQQPIYECPNCGYQGPADIQNEVESLPQIVGFDQSPKGSVVQELFSGLQVKVSAFAKKQEDCGYLLLEFVQAVPMLRSIFQDQADKITGKNYQREWSQFNKLPLHYFDQTPDNAANVSCLWLRRWQFWQLGPGKKDLIQHLTKLYPEGCYAIYIDDELMDVVAENMDDHWTFSHNPFGTSVYARPLGENLATIQDIRGELVELELQTIEHGIPETFADPSVLDFKKYGEGRSKPGQVTQAKPKAGKSLSDAFYANRTATLSQEVAPFKESIDQDAQFVLGSFPSVYGGPSTGGSKTASEYSQSRSMALQRLGTIWKTVCVFWSQFQSRSAIEFATTLKELGQDEKFTKREGANNFVNVWIRSTALNGRIGRVEPEASEQLPATWAQKKDSITQLLASGVDQVIATLTHPNNAELMKQIIGIPEFYIPGEDDRLRQRKEFMALSQGQPVPTNPFDNDAIHAEVLKSILEGTLGESLIPQGMQACMMHLQEHEQKMAEQAQAQMKQQGQEEGNEGPKGSPNKKSAKPPQEQK